MKIHLFDEVGGFAENKEKAKSLRVRKISPALKRAEQVEIDFDRVSLATQSFLHALIAAPIRSNDYDALDLITFSNCSDNARS